jgi:hypothetical protein
MIHFSDYDMLYCSTIFNFSLTNSYLAFPYPYIVKALNVPRKARTFMVSLLRYYLRLFHLSLLFSMYWTIITPPMLPMKDQPSVVQIMSLLIYINFRFPSSVKVWKAIFGLSLYFCSSSSSFFCLLVLCSK